MTSEIGARSPGAAVHGTAPPLAGARISGPETVVRRAEFRKEIQGLRAVAVVSVVCFHLRPWVLPGGFVGVDVFFVISGYLITDLLLREFEATGRVSVSGFYARRLKRLLPAATVVILVVAACVGFLPAARWRDTASEMIAGGLYCENLLLAKRTINYFAPAAVLAPLRHYWSLSVEEQYCILWPLLLVAGRRFRVFRNHPRRSLGCATTAVAIASLAWSMHLTPTRPRVAYFSTCARTWEFALGGLLASFQDWKGLDPRLRQVLGVVGLALIAAAAIRFDESTRLPGYAALAPTIGAALVVASGGASGLRSPLRILESPPAQYFGNLSYSIYLWHWPVFVFLRAAGNAGGIGEVVLVLLISTALAHQSKDLIEDPFRKPGFAARSAVQPFLFAAGSVLLVGLASAMVVLAANRRSSPPNYRELMGSKEYPGAAALTDGAAAPAERVRFLPSPVDGGADQPEQRPRGCWQSETGSDVKLCHYGHEGSSTHVVLIGDSHAMHWIPALARVAEHRGWRLTAITKSSCGFADVPLVTKELLRNDSCAEWSSNVSRELERLAPGAVVIGQSAGLRVFGAASRDEDAERLSAAYARRWSELQQSGIRVAVIRDTPVLNVEVPDCLSSRSGTIQSCSFPRESALRTKDPLVMAAQRIAGVKLIDMTDAICTATTCAPVVGNVLVFRDSHHLTASYSRTIAPALERVLAPFVEGAE